MRSVLAAGLLLCTSFLVTADETTEQSSAAKPAAEKLKTTPDALPEGMLEFNGMLLGRLAAKDVEKGTFLVRVDAVPRVWRNSKAENPKSVIGKTVAVKGVFGKFLDVLVVARKGETLEFECKHDGQGLTFPGELLRKAAPYDPQYYPELPEEFRGFHGSVLADIRRKDPETLEMIVEVQKVLDTAEDSRAKKAKGIEGNSMLLAGFWNRRDDYHELKVGDRIEAGIKHISVRSDHVSLDKFVRKVDAPADPKMKRGGKGGVEDGLTKELRGFRGMLVGRLVDKDVERGTFSITVDAVPRVWKNNESTNPKSFIGKTAAAGGVHGKLLDVLVVARPGETVEFGGLHDGGDRLRVVEVLRKVAPVKPGDYPELPDEFRGYRGVVEGKVLKRDEHMMSLIVQVSALGDSFSKSRAKSADSVIGKPVTLTGFWRRKEAFHDVSVGDTIRCGVEHPQRLSDHLSVIEMFEKVGE